MNEGDIMLYNDPTSGLWVAKPMTKDNIKLAGFTFTLYLNTTIGN